MASQSTANYNTNPKLSQKDNVQLQEFWHMQDMVRARTSSVAKGFHQGCYLVGRPGTSKTNTVLTQLQEYDEPFTIRNSRMTSLGLYALLNEHPHDTIVLDDLPSLMSERPAQQILLAALGGEPGHPRTVTYTTKEVDGRQSFQFHGGIIAISNLPLRRDPLADAIASRIPILEHEPTDEMIAAFMRHCATQGYKDLSAEECTEIVEIVIEEARNCEYSLDLRFMTRGFEDYRFDKSSKSRVGWRELFRTSLLKIVVIDASARAVTREEVNQNEQKIARDLLERFPGRKDKQKRGTEWMELTGKSLDTLYRRIRQLKTQGLA